ncbi:MAG: class I SAM-dependent methyltransferase [Acidobacteria bacterium]|jgi:ubiquinone/menaquinone biosynthesis C-methylase UbiE|nr:class I SAM-dependent methyltransferase [Acidobacteriota bacterium]MBA4123890.1 class I SAM-dependent methyltransferase [Acidobacteriota bacterium]
MSRQGQPQEPTVSNIKEFWEREAQEIGRTPQVTIRDHYFRVHELHTLVALVPTSESLLDVGCGTGLGTLALARKAKSSVGMDYSGEMIVWAQRVAQDEKYRLELENQFLPLWALSRTFSSVEFRQGDILNLPKFEQSFDVVTGQRILINLPSDDLHLEALRSLHTVSNVGATLVLVEATRQGHERTDEFRQEFGLPALEKYWHNHYVDESRTNEWEASGWKVEQALGFETYTLLSKVIYPASIGQENCSFLSGANRAAMECACLARSSAAVDEMGLSNLLQMYIERVFLYEPKVAPVIKEWVAANLPRLTLAPGLGHQKLFIARAVDISD